MRIKKIFIFTLMALLVLPLFFFRDLTPDNELKYISIVSEAFDKGNIFAFYNHGVPYADKPPLYFWIIMMTKNIVGSYSLPAIGIFSIVPAVLIIVVMSRWTSSQLGEDDQILASGMLFTTAIFLGGALILRMDMLMTLFIVLALFSFYRCYTGEGRSWEPYLIWLWIFLAVFTKGPLGIIIPVAAIVVFLISEKKLSSVRKYLPLGGGVFFLGMMVLWLASVYFEGGKDYLYNLTVKQTVGRGINSFKHNRPFYYYFQEFPVIFLPWSFMYLVTFILGIKNRQQASTMERFFKVVVISTFALLSIISSKLEIYLLPIYPFVTFLSMMQFRRLKREGYWKWCLALPAVLISLLFPGFVIAGFFTRIPIEGDAVLYSGLIIVSILGLYSVRNILKGNFSRSSWGIILGILFLIFFLSFKIDDMNNEIGLRVLAEKGKSAQINYQKSSYYAFNFEKAENMDFYLKDTIININDIGTLKELSEKENIILFVRNKDIRRNEELKNLLDNMKLVYETGSNSVYQDLFIEAK